MVGRGRWLNSVMLMVRMRRANRVASVNHAGSGYLILD